MTSNYLHQFATFSVVSITSIGAFLDWGNAEKDLFLPSSEQTERLEIDDLVSVYVFEDKQGRPCASMRLERFVLAGLPLYKPEEKVRALIYHETELGYKAIVDQKYAGLFYKNEVFTPLHCGDEVDAYVKKVRTDHKIDLNLRAAGHGANHDIGEKILELLQRNKGFFALDDKIPPEQIYELFGVSKKKYKLALGQLYKSRKISISDDGIHLTAQGKSQGKSLGKSLGKS